MARIIKVAKIGEQYRNISVDGAITYRGLIKLAGFSGTESVMAENYGAVILDEPIADNVSSVVVNMPKIAGGTGILPAGLRVVDENGVEWVPVVDEEEDDDDDDDNMWDLEDDDDDEDVFDDEPVEEEQMSRVIRVAQLGKEYVELDIVGAITYRGLLQLAGYSGAEGVYAEGYGSVIMDEPVADNVSSVVVNMPKIAGGLHQ